MYRCHAKAIHIENAEYVVTGISWAIPCFNRLHIPPPARTIFAYRSFWMSVLGDSVDHHCMKPGCLINAGLNIHSFGTHDPLIVDPNNGTIRNMFQLGNLTISLFDLFHRAQWYSRMPGEQVEIIGDSTFILFYIITSLLQIIRFNRSIYYC